jgi:secreted PhoX family phosphatase
VARTTTSGSLSISTRTVTCSNPGEGLARWASNGTAGSEFTGLYFDFRKPNRAYVNIQHPSSGVDRLIEISADPHSEQGNK